MSYEESLKSITLDADSSIGFYTGVPGTVGAAAPNTGKMYHFIKLVDANTVGLCTDDADAVIGVLQNKPQVVGAAATVGYSGVSNIQAGEALSAGDLLVPDADGQAVQGAGGKWLALADTTVEGELVPALKV